MSPKRANLILPSHIPNIELDVLIGDSLDVEADGRNRSNVRVELQFVEDCYDQCQSVCNRAGTRL